MFKSFSIDISDRTLKVEIGRAAEFTNGSCLVYYGDTVVLVTATASEKPREGIDFFPLSIDYEEKLYSVGKIPGGFIKREGRPTERAILTSRLIDRPLRPLFPDNYRNDVSIVATVLSVDQDASPEIAAMIGSSIALAISDIPIQAITAAVNIGLIDGNLVVNPDSTQREKTRLSLIVSSTNEKVMMIESGADEIEEDEMLRAIKLAHEENKKIIKFIENITKEVSKPKSNYNKIELDPDFYKNVANFITYDKMREAVFTDQKQKREEKISELTQETFEHFKNYEEDQELLSKKLKDIIYKFQKETVRDLILNKHIRPDGRAVTDIRPLTAEIDILPRTHGSAIFKRGQTQVLTVTTLGSIGEAQRLDGLDELEGAKRYMHHYNFPSYSVGEVRPSRGPGRREIGHGALAERSLLPVIPSEEEFPYAIRLVSEVLSSNGSTSQASVCASTLSLMAAGVPLKRAVAGISVGLITDKNSNDFVLLTDIQGIEDFFGDMDFKVAGTHKGITAIQMDIKINGLSFDIIEKSLNETKRAREYILNGVMLKAIEKPRENLSKYAPKIQIIKIEPDMISEIIGPKGKTIKRIIEETCVEKIDTFDDGRIFVASNNEENVTRATNMIKSIVTKPKPGVVYTGKVIRITNFGAFIEIAPEKEGLIHISKISHSRIKKVEDVLKIGDNVTALLTDIDKQGRINLSIKALLPKPLDDDKDLNN